MRDSDRAALTLTGDAGAVAAQLTDALESTSGFDPGHYQDWRQQLADKVCVSLSQFWMEFRTPLSEREVALSLWRGMGARDLVRFVFWTAASMRWSFLRTNC